MDKEEGWQNGMLPSETRTDPLPHILVDLYFTWVKSCTLDYVSWPLQLPITRGLLGESISTLVFIVFAKYAAASEFDANSVWQSLRTLAIPSRKSVLHSGKARKRRTV